MAIHDIQFAVMEPDENTYESNLVGYWVDRGYEVTGNTKTSYARNPETGKYDVEVEKVILEKIEYAGAVFQTRERNYHDDSDFYAVVWDGERIRSVEYATTRFACSGYANADATPEVEAAARVYLRSWVLSEIEKINPRVARTPEVGREVKVVKGRKVAKGTVGRVFWYGKGRKFSYNDIPDMRVGIETPEGEKYFTAAHNVEVIHPERFELNETELARFADRKAARLPFHAPVSGGPGLVVL